jgi:hypothetical protein
MHQSSARLRKPVLPSSNILMDATQKHVLATCPPSGSPFSPNLSFTL